MYTCIYAHSWFKGTALAAEMERNEEEKTPSNKVSASCSRDYKELKQRKKRCKDLERIVQKMTTKKQLMVSRGYII